MWSRGRNGRDCMVVRFKATYTITTNLVSSNPTRARCTRYNIVWSSCQWNAVGRWFYPCTPVYSNNKTDRHHIAELLLKVALNTINSIQAKPNQTMLKWWILTSIVCAKIAFSWIRDFVGSVLLSEHINMVTCIRWILNFVACQFSWIAYSNEYWHTMKY